MSQSVYSFLASQLEHMEQSLENSKLLSIACGALRISCSLASLGFTLAVPVLSASAKRSCQGYQRFANAPVLLCPHHCLGMVGACPLPPESGYSPTAVSAVSQAPLTLQSLTSLLCFHAGFLPCTLNSLGTETCLLPIGVSSASTGPHFGDASPTVVDRADCLCRCPRSGGTRRFLLTWLHPEFSRQLKSQE